MNDNCSEEMTGQLYLCHNTYTNENPQYISCLDFHFQNEKFLKHLFQIKDVAICKICISFNNPEDVDQYIIYHLLDGVIYMDPNDIYSFNPGEVLAISCPHNQVDLKNFSKDIGHILIKYILEIKNQQLFINLGTQGHFKIEYFNQLCINNDERDDIIFFLQFELYPLLIKSKIDTQKQGTSTFLVNIMHYIKVLSNPNKTLRRNIEN